MTGIGVSNGAMTLPSAQVRADVIVTLTARDLPTKRGGLIMRAVVQRVSRASVTVDGAVVGQIGPGYLILVCAMQGDTDAEAVALAAKIIKLRIFKDEGGKMNRALRDIGGAALVVSQFTLAADLRGNRPGFSRAAAPEDGKRLYEQFADLVAAEGVPVQRGIFGADMDVSLNNDGPVTIWMDTATM